MSWALGKGMVRADFLEVELIVQEILQGKKVKSKGRRRGQEKSGELGGRERGARVQGHECFRDIQCLFFGCTTQLAGS